MTFLPHIVVTLIYMIPKFELKIRSFDLGNRFDCNESNLEGVFFDPEVAFDDLC